MGLLVSTNIFQRFNGLGLMSEMHNTMYCAFLLISSYVGPTLCGDPVLSGKQPVNQYPRVDTIPENIKYPPGAG